VESTSIAVVIVYYSGLEDLMRCLECLASQTLPPQEVIVVDNSEAGDCAGLRLPAALPFRVRRSEANTGFAAGNNVGMSLAKTELVALLNPDAFADRRWLERLAVAAGIHQDCASFGSLQLKDEKPELIDGLGDLYQPSGIFRREGHGRHLAGLQPLRPREIFSPCAAAALYRRDAVLAVGGFDEDFFCYGEDIDLGFRLRLAGWKSMLVPDAVVRHLGSSSSGGQRSDFATYHGHRNMVWVYVKNMPGFLFWLFLPLHVLANFASVLVLALRGQDKVAWRAKCDAIKGLLAVWKKRQAIQFMRVASFKEIWHAFSW